jgi:hypothetical protein
MNRLTDTSPEARRILDEIHRAMPAWRKWDLLSDLYRYGRELHAAGVRLRKPDATPAEIRDDWIATHVGDIPRRPAWEEDRVDGPIEFRRVVREVIAALNLLGIDYALGGSLASSIHGINRNTADADLTVEPFPGQEAQFVGGFGPDYYVNVEAVRQAVRERATFNIIDTMTGFKVDVFVRKDRPFESSLMRRRVPMASPDASGPPIDVVSPEDIILLKLEWYRLGGETSDRQWSDVQNVLRVQAGRLDEGYLDHWAGELGVADLLARARGELAE